MLVHHKSNFKQEKPASGCVSINIYCFYNFLRVWEFFGSSHQHILIWQNNQHSELLCSLIILGNFAFGGNRGKFSEWQLGHGCLQLLFSNSAISQLTPPNILGNYPKTKAQCKSLHLKMALGQLPKLLGSCPCGYMGLFGQLPIFHT